jgi:hypothetical protein
MYEYSKELPQYLRKSWSTVAVNRESQTSCVCYHRSAICIEKMYIPRHMILGFKCWFFRLKPPDLAGSPRELYYG